MEIEYHPLVRSDITGILDWYDARSDMAGDRFFAEFEKTVEEVASGKRHGFRLDSTSRKILFRRFPYSMSYEITESRLFVFVVKHQKRRYSFGMNRR